MREAKDSNSTFYKEKGEKNLQAVIGELFVGGSETSSNTLSFAILYLSQNQQAQAKAQQELDRVVGTSRQISLTDKSSLPYTEAIILETLRLSSLLTLGSPHRMISDTMFQGYFLPKGTVILANLYGIHHNPKIWGEDVNSFRPERFLNDDETQVVRNEALIPFGTGKRQCLGEGLARDTLFIFLASILHKFSIQLDPEGPILRNEIPSGLMIEPEPFQFILNRRK